jgi:hypothetical protein
MRYWVGTAPLEHLLSWRSPEQIDPQSLAAFKPLSLEVVKRYRWIVERFTETFLANWSTSSLHLEFRWIRREIEGPCSDDQMNTRPAVQIAELNAEIASRAVRESSPDERPKVLANQIKDQAVGFLRQGRRMAAAALFEALVGISPKEAENHNNLGFCLIPDRPQQALKEFEEALRLQFPSRAMVTHNQMMAHLALGQPRLAIGVADGVWDLISEPKTYCPAYLWSKDGESWRLDLAPDAALAVAELAKSLAASLKRVDVQMWEGRRLSREAQSSAD